MQIKIAITKIDKHGSINSGDTVEITERPNGGISIVMADGVTGQPESKAISTLITHRVIDHISSGMRDGASIRTAGSRIFEAHQGEVQANLWVLSADLQTNTIIISRSNAIPVFLISEEKVDCLYSGSELFGSRLEISPTIIELPIKPEITVVAFSDGVFNAGKNIQQSMDICTTLEAFVDEQEPTEREIAEFLLNRAIRLDNGQPQDDMSIIVLQTSSRPTDNVRRMNISLPLE
ncbi:MAG: SpoIIE family protein phosphatase [Chloroflexi bacterium]|jgi:serine phosphatase RsbU (regulator of sigma subunit)|nr:SpoIIE family protein phosphatase [Chloroflexota bacterium]